MLEVTIEGLSNASILRCVGRIVCGHEGALLCAAVGRYERNLILDLNQIDALDGAGVGALISLQAAGIYLQLMNPSQTIREVLRVTELDSIFEICSGPLTGNHEPRGSPQHAIDGTSDAAAALDAGCNLRCRASCFGDRRV